MTTSISNCANSIAQHAGNLTVSGVDFTNFDSGVLSLKSGNLIVDIALLQQK